MERERGEGEGEKRDKGGGGIEKREGEDEEEGSREGLHSFSLKHNFFLKCLYSKNMKGPQKGKSELETIQNGSCFKH